jgi:UDP-N-acetylglucosamine 2-epimerase (non-hydrolysing)
LNKYEDQINLSDVVARLNLTKNDYFVVSAHREENIDLNNNFEVVAASLNAVAEKYQKPVIFSTHPRTRNRIEKNKIKFHPLITNIPPLGFFDYVNLQKNAFVVLSDSGTISEESGMMGFPAVSIRTSTERPEALDAGTIVLGGISTDQILNSIEITKGLAINKNTDLPWEYNVINTSERIVKVIQSYTSIVNKVIWGK